jgi:hypothetical protein
MCDFVQRHLMDELILLWQWSTSWQIAALWRSATHFIQLTLCQWPFPVPKTENCLQRRKFSVCLGHQDFRVTQSTHKGSHIALCSVHIEELNTCTVQTEDRKSIINGQVAKPKVHLPLVTFVSQKSPFLIAWSWWGPVLTFVNCCSARTQERSFPAHEWHRSCGWCTYHKKLHNR